MEQAELERLRQQFDGEVRRRFAGAPIQRVVVLQYGDEPAIEPGQLLARVILDVPAPTSGGTEEDDKEQRGQVLEGFHAAHRAAIKELRRELDRLPAVSILEFVAGEPSEGERGGPKLKLAGGPRGFGSGGGEGPFTPVMARLGQEDLETLDTL